MTCFTAPASKMTTRPYRAASLADQGKVSPGTPLRVLILSLAAFFLLVPLHAQAGPVSALAEPGGQALVPVSDAAGYPEESGPAPGNASMPQDAEAAPEVWRTRCGPPITFVPSENLQDLLLFEIGEIDWDNGSLEDPAEPDSNLTGCLVHASPRPSLGQSGPSVIPVPPGIAPIGPGDPPERILQAFLGIAYRPDGVTDEQGRYTIFSRQDDIQGTPGLNCSGYVLAVSRFLFDRNIPLAVVGFDRLGDSGPDSALGHDWDFGYDLILNLTDGLERVFLLPGYQTAAPEDTSGATRGFDLHDLQTWEELRDRLKQDAVYLVSFNKTTRKAGYSLMHYHVGILYLDGLNQLWMYNTTTGAKKSYRRNLSDPREKALFHKAFANTGKERKFILILEVPLDQNFADRNSGIEVPPGEPVFRSAPEQAPAAAVEIQE